MCVHINLMHFNFLTYVIVLDLFLISLTCAKEKSEISRQILSLPPLYSTAFLSVDHDETIISEKDHEKTHYMILLHTLNRPRLT
jgi:hypothetical protein